MNLLVSIPGMFQIPCVRRPSSSAKLFIHTVRYFYILMSSKNSRDFLVPLLMIDPAK